MIICPLEFGLHDLIGFSYQNMYIFCPYETQQRTITNIILLTMLKSHVGSRNEVEPTTLVSYKNNELSGKPQFIG